MITAGTCLLILAVGFNKIPKPTERDAFFLRKYEALGPYDLVVAGDSRIDRGIDPTILSQEVPALRVKNAGYLSVAFDNSYLDYIHSLVDRGGKKIVVLGISAYSLTPRATIENGFQTVRATSFLERKNVAWTFPFWHRPADPSQPAYVVAKFHDDQWTGIETSDPHTDEANEIYKANFARNTVSPAIVENLAQVVKTWTSEGITVIALRMPTTEKVAGIERSLGGFDLQAIRSQLTDAGGKWLELPESDPGTYDGSHLTESAAKRISKICGQQISLLTHR